MIVKNEEFLLGRCLEECSEYVDEIIIVDTGSTDKTVDVAKQFVDQVYFFEWCNDFSKARNFSLSKARGEWILVLDADELIDRKELVDIRNLISSTVFDAFFLTERNYTNDIRAKNWLPVAESSRFSMDYLGYQTFPICRLFRNCEDIKYQGKIHEVVDDSLAGLAFTSVDIAIHHHGDSDPSKPQHDRQMRYLAMMEQELEVSENPRLLEHAAIVHLYRTQQYAKAVEYFERAIAEGSQVGLNSDLVAEAYYRMGDIEKAKERYLSLFESGYLSLNLCNNLANLHVRSGELSEAVNLLESALHFEDISPVSKGRIQQNLIHLQNQLQ